MRPLPGVRAGLRGRGTAPPDIVLSKVDTEAEQELAAAAGIWFIPDPMAFRDGVLVFAQPGALPAEALEELVTAVRGLDMDKVRADLADERRTACLISRADR